MSAARNEGGQRLWALFTDTPQLGDVEQACHYINTHRQNRDQHPLNSRQWHIERIKLDWWVGKLVEATGHRP